LVLLKVALLGMVISVFSILMFFFNLVRKGAEIALMIFFGDLCFP
jgi:hypothetical protein